MNQATALKLLWHWSNQSTLSRRLNGGASRPSTEDGVTLLECIMAMLVIVVTVTMITPPIFLSVATRVQNQRIEQAMQLAQAELDRVQLTVERGDYTTDDLPSVTTVADVRQAPAPSGTTDARADATVDDAYTVDVNNDGDDDYAVQFFRTEGESNASGDVLVFDMGVRVYSMMAFEDGSTRSIEQASALFTAGTGSQSSSPLSVMFTTIARGDSSDSFDAINQYRTPSP